MPEQSRHLANKYEDIVNLQGAGHIAAVSRTACCYYYYYYFFSAQGIDTEGGEKTRSSADADNRLDAFSGQSRSKNMVPFHMLHI